MADTMRNVIILGGSGNIGASILKALVNSSKFDVTVLTRPSSSNQYSAEIRTIVSDYSQSSLVEAFKGQDVVVSVLGAGGLGDESKIIDAAVTAGVKRFIPSQFGSNTQNKKACGLLPILSGKAAVIEHLKKQEVHGLSWTGITTGLAFDWGVHVGLLGFDINKRTALIMDGGDRAFSTTNLSQIGNAVVAVLSRPDQTRNQMLYIHSFTATQNEVLTELQKATDSQWEVKHGTAAEAVVQGLALFEKGEFSGLLLLLNAISLGDGYGSNHVLDAELGNSKLGLPEQTLQQTARAVASGSMM